MSPEPNHRKKDEEILDSLNGIRRAKAPAFFYTRLRARMEKELEMAGGGGTVGRLLTKPVLALTIAAIILLLNITAISQMWKQDRLPPADNNGQQIVMTGYSMDTYPVYDETPVEP